jgi:Fe-Mn family superoxide dismutase
MSKEDKDLTKKFIAFLQTKYPLKNDLKVTFLGDRKGEMSTGSRTMDSELKILSKGRLNRDVLRTLAHEWVHEHQMKILKRQVGPDIGGKNEDEANAFAGQLIKMFEKKHPEIQELMFESRGIEKRLMIINEQLLITEKQTIKENLMVEMKKIGIEKLPYSYSSLKRFIDSKTMDIHYNKHYKGYVDKLNKSLKDKEGDMDLEEIIKSIGKFDDKVRNNAGGSFNHALFWKMLSPKKQLPKGEILKKITSDFGNIKKMKDEFNEAAKDRFGSGWAWLYLAKDGKLKIMSTPNQDNPLMGIVKGGGYPLLGLDVWEHAYYLKYQNKRDEYIKKFWDVVNWEFVEELYLSKTNKEKKQIKESTDNFQEKKPTKTSMICDFVMSKGKENSPFCRLNDYLKIISDNFIVNEIDESINRLSKFFTKKSIGVFPMIVELSLKNPEDTSNYLKLIADFIEDKEFDDEYTKRVLKKQKNASLPPPNLEALLSYARFKEHEKHENKYTNTEFFKKKATKLQLNYHCGDDVKEKMIESLMKIKNKELTLDFYFFRITKCLVDSFRSGPYYIKSDMEVDKDLMDENGDVIFPKGSFIEAKKMDPFIDSYLSEFFSIFKQSNLLGSKPIVIDLYNQLIDRIFVWLLKNEKAKNYLDKVKNAMTGILYEGDIIVPIKYIQLYWSNKGQRGCDEKRLSIRFRIDPQYSSIESFKFKFNDVLEKVILNVPANSKELIVCPTNE